MNTKEENLSQLRESMITKIHLDLSKTLKEVNQHSDPFDNGRDEQLEKIRRLKEAANTLKVLNDYEIKTNKESKNIDEHEASIIKQVKQLDTDILNEIQEEINKGD